MIRSSLIISDSILLGSLSLLALLSSWFISRFYIHLSIRSRLLQIVSPPLLFSLSLSRDIRTAPGHSFLVSVYEQGEFFFFFFLVWF